MSKRSKNIRERRKNGRNRGMRARRCGENKTKQTRRTTVQSVSSTHASKNKRALSTLARSHQSPGSSFSKRFAPPEGLRPFGKKLSERHGAIFRALKNPRASSRPLKTRSERIHARRRCQTMRKRDDNIGYKDDTLHILTVLTKICMFGCKANLFVERRRGCVNSHFCNLF